MRYFYLLILFTLVADVSAFGQRAAKQDTSSHVPPASATIRIRCHSTVDPGKEPLYIVDGYPIKPGLVQELLNPDNIESISILKGIDALATYGSLAGNGVIYIKTKKSWLESFYAVDAEDDNSLAGATFTFVSVDGKDSLRFVADEEGKIQIPAFSIGKKYRVTITSVGYRTFFTTYTPTTQQTIQRIRLSRDVRENPEVIVVGYGTIRCRFVSGCGGSLITTCNIDAATNDSADRKRITSALLYPNPVTRGSIVKLEIDLKEETFIQARVSNLSGAALSTISYKPVKGLNRVELPVASHWAAGVYFVQLIAKDGRLLNQEKLIIQ